MRSAYGAEETGIGAQLVTIVVDVANVMGSRPDGWWRDRAGAAVRLHAEIARLAASGRAILRDEPGEDGEPGEPGVNEAEQASAPGFVMVLEGAAKAAAARLAPAEPDARAEPDAQAEPDARAEPDTPGAPGAPSGSAAPDAALPPVRPGEVRVVQAAGSGDDAIVAVVRQLSGRRVVVTADRELRERCVAAGAEIRGPGWLLGLLRG
jgi:8-oxo-dGTP diphosphatase